MPFIFGPQSNPKNLFAFKFEYNLNRVGGEYESKSYNILFLKFVFEIGQIKIDHIQTKIIVIAKLSKISNNNFDVQVFFSLN
jgi:hypothetical protein